MTAPARVEPQGESTTTAVARPICGAKTKAGTPCRFVAGYKTPHLGQGRCSLHGGLTPIRHGRYSTINRPRLRELIAEHAGDANPLDILPEIAALRALFQDYVERYDVHVEALLAWHMSFQLTRRRLPAELLAAFTNVVDDWEEALRSAVDPTERQTQEITQARKFLAVLAGPDADIARPRSILDLADARSILGEIGRMVERVEKIRSANAISRPELNRIMQELWRSVELRVGEQPIKDAIREDWMQVAL